MDPEKFIYHTEQALEVARAAQFCLQATELQLKTMVTEGELNLRVLKDEIEDVKIRCQAARYQVASLRATLQSAGVTPKNPPFFPPVDGYEPTPSTSYDPLSTDRRGSTRRDRDIYFSGNTTGVAREEGSRVDGADDDV